MRVDDNVKQTRKTNQKEATTAYKYLLGSPILYTSMGEDDQKTSTMLKITCYKKFTHNKLKLYILTPNPNPNLIGNQRLI